MLSRLALHWRIVFFLVWMAGVLFMVHHTFEPIEQHFIGSSRVLVESADPRAVRGPNPLIFKEAAPAC